MTKITFLGDIMFDYAMVSAFSANSIPLNSECFCRSLVHIKPLLNKSDYVIGNLETPISWNNSQLTYKPYEFNTSIDFAKAIKTAGVDFVTTANNHMMDRGIEGLKSTYNSLCSIGLEQCGINLDNTKRFRVINVNGLKIGVLAYTYGTNAFANHKFLSLKKHEMKYINLLQEQEGSVVRTIEGVLGKRIAGLYKRYEDHKYVENETAKKYEKRTIDIYRRHLINQDLKMVKSEKVDFLVACLHIGGQYRSEPLDYTLKASQWFIEQGCDAVICNHEHVVHGISLDNDLKLTAYALGNCLGSSGVTAGPYDRRSEYSVALHIYIDHSSLNSRKFSFSVLKTILSDDKYYETWPVYDLLCTMIDHNEKEKLTKESLQVALDFSGQKYETIEPEMIISK